MFLILSITKMKQLVLKIVDKILTSKNTKKKKKKTTFEMKFILFNESIFLMEES